MELAQLMLLVGFVGSSSMLFYILFNICLKLVFVHAREFNTNVNASNVAIISNYIKKSYFYATSTNGDKTPIGLIIGKWYIAYVTTINIQKRDCVSIGYNIVIWSSNAGHEKSLEDNFNDLENPENTNSNAICSQIAINTIETWRHVGAYKGDTIEKFNVTFYNKECEEQTTVINHMIKMANTSFVNGCGYRLITMISGPCGLGKTQIVKQFAKMINATVCDDFNPTTPGQNFASLVKTINPSKKKPLVVLFDEGDKIINEIHKGIKDHEFFVISATNKSTFNTFMDHLSNYENVFVVFTMNSTFREINELDLSYSRVGRVNLKINFGGDDSYNPFDESFNESNGNFIHIQPFYNIAEDIDRIRFTSQQIDITIDDKKTV